MQFLKRFSRGLASTLLKFTLFGAAITASLVAVFASPVALKNSLAENNLYDGLVQNILSAVENYDEPGESGAPADKQRSLDVLKSSATKAFTPEVLQTATEQGLDGIYRWLNGEVAQPDFRIDLSQAKANFITAAGVELENYVAGLPVCTTAQMRTLDPDTDPFALVCRPPGLTAAAIKDQELTELANSDKFFPNPVITADNLAKNENGKNFFEQAEGAQSFYKTVKALPWILLVLGVLSAAAVIFLNETKRKGAKSAGMSVLGVGIFLFFTTWLFGFLFGKAAEPGGMLGNSINNDFRESLLALIRSLNDIFNRTVLVYCLAYIALGAAVLTALHFTKPKESEDKKSDPETAKTKEPTEKPEPTKPEKTLTDKVVKK